MIAIPNFSEICRVYNYEGVDKRNAALEYTTMVEDFERKSDLFTALFLEVHGLCLGNPQSAGESPLNYSKRIFNLSFKIRRSQQSQFCHHSVRIPHKAV